MSLVRLLLLNIRCGRCGPVATRLIGMLRKDVFLGVVISGGVEIELGDVGMVALLVGLAAWTKLFRFCFSFACGPGVVTNFFRSSSGLFCGL